MNGEIDMIYQRFLAHVAEGRNMTVEEVMHASALVFRRSGVD